MSVISAAGENGAGGQAAGTDEDSQAVGFVLDECLLDHEALRRPAAAFGEDEAPPVKIVQQGHRGQRGDDVARRHLADLACSRLHLRA